MCFTSRVSFVIALCACLLASLGALEQGEAHGIPVVLLEGNGPTRGAEMAQVNGGMLGILLFAVRQDGWFTADPERMDVLKKEMDPDHLAQIDHLAKGAGLQPNDVLSTCLAIDTLCSVVVREAKGDRPLRVGRNLEFPMAEVLSPATQITIERPEGRYAFASVGWPGYVPVVSGMNEHGVVATILLNRGSVMATSKSTGAPVAFRVREILERAATLDEAIEVFGRTPLMTSHYVAISTPETAAVVWWDSRRGVKTRHFKDGWLTCTNGKPNAQKSGRDLRTRILRELIDENLGDDIPDLIKALREVELKGLNAQAMVFEPASRHLHLALAAPNASAVEAPFRPMDFSDVFEGKALKDSQLELKTQN